MIDTADLQAFLEKIQGGTIPVDLLKIGQAHYAQYANAGEFRFFCVFFMSMPHMVDSLSVLVLLLLVLLSVQSIKYACGK